MQTNMLAMELYQYRILSCLKLTSPAGLNKKTYLIDVSFSTLVCYTNELDHR